MVASKAMAMLVTAIIAVPSISSQVSRLPKMPRSMRVIGADGGKKVRMYDRVLGSFMRTPSSIIGAIMKIIITPEYELASFAVGVKVPIRTLMAV